MKHNKVDYKTHKSTKTSPCLDLNLENATLQYSVFPAELQRWSVILWQTIVNIYIFTYNYITIFRTTASRVYR